jgi:hypothetical protein
MSPLSPKRAFKKGRYKEMNKWLQDMDWSVLFELKIDCTAFYQFFMEIIRDAIERFVPLAPKLSRRSALPPRLHALRKKRFQLLRSRHTNPSLYRHVNKTYSKSLTNFFLARERCVSKGSPHGVFRWLQQMQGSSSSVPILRRSDGSIIDDAKEKALAFAEKFAADFQTDDGSVLPLVHPPTGASYSGPVVTPHIVAQTLKTMSPKMSCGPDGIPLYLLKRVAVPLSVPLCELFARTLATGDVPEQWLGARTVPVRKAGAKDGSSTSSYRPISLGSSVARILEKLVNTRLMSYLEASKQLPTSQYGFRRGRSTTSQIVDYLDEITRLVSSGKCAYAVYLDIKGAFLAPPYPKLISSLRSCGIVSPLLDWLSFYLSNRTTFVEVDGARSESFHVSSGGLQGSALSGTAFLCYLSPILREIESLDVAVYGYADDVKIVSSDPSALQLALDTISRMMSERQLKLSLHKCCAVAFGNGNGPEPALSIENVPIAFLAEPSVRDLGVQVDPRLSFTHHVAYVTAKARSVCGRILRCFNVKDPTCFAQAFKSCVIPILEYATPAWNSISSADSSSIESVQKFFTRRVLHKCRLPARPYADRLKFLGLSMLSVRRNVSELSFAHSVYHSRHFNATLSKAESTARYPVSHRMRLTIERKPKSLRRLCPKNKIGRMWNRLSDTVLSLKPKSFREHMLKQLTRLN